MSDVSLEVKGLKEAQRKAEQVVKDLGPGGPMEAAMRDATLLVTGDAKRNAPVDTGRLRASITPEVTSGFGQLTGIVGSNVEYAPYQELGTRFMPGKHYLGNAVSKNIGRINRMFQRAAEEIANK